MRLPARYTICLLAFVGFIFNYMLRININLAIVSMVNHTALSKIPNNSTQIRQDGPFLWDSEIRNHVMGSFYWGYLVMQVPGGRLAEVIGGKKVLAVSMGGTALLTLLIPEAAKLYGYGGYPYPLVIVRTLMGLFEGATFPCVTAMMARWAPQTERSTMTTLIFTGSQIGIIISNQLTGLIAGSLGWEYVFYIQGTACFLWVLAWILWSSDCPATHKSISPEEKKYIEINLPSTSASPLPFPLLSILRSPPFWAILVANVANNWGFYLIITELPQYFSEVFNKDLFELAWLSALPYACMWIFSLLVARSADFLIVRNMSTAIVRKICNSVAHVGSATCLLVIVATVSTDNKREMLTKIMFTLAVTLQGAAFSGFVANTQDIAPNFAGTILGITNAIGAIPGWVAPIVAGKMVNADPSDVTRWRNVWVVAVAVLLAEAAFFIFFAKGKTQEWNGSNNDSSHTEDDKDRGNTDNVKLTRFSICSTNSAFDIN